MELYDAAREAGASPVEVWWRVAVPLTKGVTAAAAVLMFILVWGDVIGPLVYVTDERWYTISLGLRSLAVLDAPRQPLMLAGAVIATIPVALSFLFLEKEGRVKRLWILVPLLALLLPACASGDDTVRVLVSGDTPPSLRPIEPSWTRTSPTAVGM